MRSVIEVERQRTSHGAPAHVDAEAIPGRTRPPAADRRRRFGRHAEARRFLAEHGGNASVTPGVWDGLLNALRYHTIQDALASLAVWERQVLHLAFLEGRTNREIAAILSISRSTVRRRMVLALANLDEQIRRAGSKASTVLLLLLAAALVRARFVGHAVSAIRTTPAANVVLTTVAGAAAGVVVFGAIASNQGATGNDRGTSKSVTQVTAGAPFVMSVPTAVSSTIDGGGPTQVPHGSAADNSGAAATAGHSNSSLLDPGCDGNPTNAPPTTPVGPRSQHLGAPVTHPAAGGCGPHGVERT